MRYRFLPVLAVMAALSAGSARGSAILDNILTGGENTLKDVDGEWIKIAPGNSTTQLQTGDTFTEVATLTNITNMTHNQTALTTALGLPNYQLAALTNDLSVTVTNEHTVGPVLLGTVTLTGTLTVNETANTAITGNAIDFTTQSQSTLVTNASAGTNILTFSVTAYADNVPLNFSQYPTSSAFGIPFSLGADVTSNPGLIPYTPGAETMPTLFLPVDFAGTVTSYRNTGANTGGVGSSSGVQFLTNTVVAFQVTTPEPATCTIWAGVGAVGFLLRARRRRNNLNA